MRLVAGLVVAGLVCLSGCGGSGPATVPGPTPVPTTPTVTPTVVVTPSGDLRKACSAVAEALPGNSFMQPSETFAGPFSTKLDALAAATTDQQTLAVLAGLQSATAQVAAIYASDDPQAKIDAGLVFQEAVTTFGEECSDGGSSSF